MREQQANTRLVLRRSTGVDERILKKFVSVKCRVTDLLQCIDVQGQCEAAREDGREFVREAEAHIECAKAERREKREWRRHIEGRNIQMGVELKYKSLLVRSLTAFPWRECVRGSRRPYSLERFCW